MANLFLQYCFHPTTSDALWEDAIRTGVTKQMPYAKLRELCSPAKREEIYTQLMNGSYPIDIPHAALIPKNEIDPATGKPKYRTVYVNKPEVRVLFRVCNAALFKLFPDWIHPTCTSYREGVSYMSSVMDFSQSLCEWREAGWTGDDHIIGVKSDLSKYFDRVPREYIDQVLDRIEASVGGDDMLIVYLRRFYHTDAYYRDHRRKELIHEYRSLKQGCAVAAFLADVILYDLDEKLSRLNVKYMRYCDDQIFVGPDYMKGYDIMVSHLHGMQMDINEKKREWIDDRRYVKFLGYNIRYDDRTFCQSLVEDVKEMVAEACLPQRKQRGDKWIVTYPTYQTAVRHLNRLLYNPNGKYSWAERVLRVVNNRRDIIQIDEYMKDALRATMTRRYEIGSIGVQLTLKVGCIDRSPGRNVTSNRHRTPDILPDYQSLVKMRDNLLTSKAMFRSLVADMA